MAQIIQHKRGVLEDLSGVTPNKGELLVVTGSSISALADGLVFVGNHSNLTSVNKILTGSSSPNLTSYDEGVNGLPFYNTTDKKLQILRKDGNIDIVLKKTSLDLDGTGIISSSAQIDGAFLNTNGDSVISSSAQLTTEFDTRYLNTNGDSVISSSAQLDSVFLKADGESVISSSAQVDATSVLNFDSNVQSFIRSIDVLSGSLDTDAVSEGSSNVYYTNARVQSFIRSEDVISGSSQVVLNNADKTGFTGAASITTLGTVTAGNIVAILPNGVVSSSAQIDGDFLNTNGDSVISSSAQLTGDFDTRYLNTNSDGVISGSSQVNADTITNFDTNVQSFIRSIDVISGSSQVTGIVDSQISGVNHSKVDFGGSNLTSGSLGLVVGDGSATDTVNVGVDTLAIVGTANEVTTAVTNNQVQIGLPDNVTVGGNMTISGNLTVSGDTVQTNVGTLNVEDNIINVNYGGSETDGGLYVSDVTGGGLTSGSILWDGTNDYWKAGAKDSEARIIVGNGTDTAGKITKFSADGVITDSIISESGTTVTISNDLILSGLTASSFLVSNGSKQLVSIASSTDGDILVSNGAGTFSATNTIDGGTF